MLKLLNDGLWIVLLGLSLAYSFLATLIIRSKKPRNLGIPVLSVGNIHLGGTGKTPLVIKLAQHFKTLKPAVASRGYKGKASRRGAQCDLSFQNGPVLYGDEPWLIAKKAECDVFVGHDRFKTLLKFQVPQKNNILILDDGFQHTQLGRKVDLVLLPGEEDPKTSACVPLGTLREPLSALKRASAVILTYGADTSCYVESWKDLLQKLVPETKIFLAKRKPLLPEAPKEGGNDKKAKSWGAFCGIARPERFFDDLKKWGKIQEEIIFKDHHTYTESDVIKIVEKGDERGISDWVTTEKDYFKAAPLFSKIGKSLFSAGVEYEYPSELFGFIEGKLGFR